MVNDELAEVASIISYLNNLDGVYLFAIDGRHEQFTQEAFEVADIMNEFYPKRRNVAKRANIWFELDSNLGLVDDYKIEPCIPYGLKDFLWKEISNNRDIDLKNILLKLTTCKDDHIKHHVMNVQGETRKNLGVRLTPNRLKHQVTDEVVRVVLGAGEVEDARLTHLALQGDFSAISVLDEDQIELITSGMETFDWEKHPDYSIRDFLIQSGMMTSDEIDAEAQSWKMIPSTRMMINGTRISDPDQIFIFDWHITPNNLSIVNLKGKPFAIKWYEESEVNKFRENQGRLLQQIINQERLSSSNPK